MEELRLMIEISKRVGTITQVQNIKTNTGIKDTFLDHFLKMMADSYRGLTSKVEKTQVLDQFCATSLPAEIISPVWRVDGASHLMMTPKTNH